MINRRNFLKTSALSLGALGITSPLPNLMGATTKSGAPCRFIFVRKGNGLRAAELSLPSFSAKERELDSKKKTLNVDMSKHELPEWLNDLSKHKKNMTILQGLSSRICAKGHGTAASCTGVWSGDVPRRASVEFELAKLFPSPMTHIELANVGLYSFFHTGIIKGNAASGPKQRNYAYADPETAYRELFKSIVDPADAKSDNDMLSFLQKHERPALSGLAGAEKRKVSNHVNSLAYLKDRNLKVSKMAGSIGDSLPALDPIYKNGGAKATTVQKQKAMTDILIASLRAGLTNVATYTIDKLATPTTGLPGNETDMISLHAIGHGEGYGGRSAVQIREQIRISHMNQVSSLVDALKNTPEGKGSMFDNTMIFYFADNGEQHHGQGFEFPTVVLSGSNCKLNIAGRYIRLPKYGEQGHQTVGNWYTTILNAYGNSIEHYGDLDYELKSRGIKEHGAIKQFLA